MKWLNRLGWVASGNSRHKSVSEKKKRVKGRAAGGWRGSYRHPSTSIKYIDVPWRRWCLPTCWTVGKAAAVIANVWPYWHLISGCAYLNRFITPYGSCRHPTDRFVPKILSVTRLLSPKKMWRLAVKCCATGVTAQRIGVDDLVVPSEDQWSQRPRWRHLNGLVCPYEMTGRWGSTLRRSGRRRAAHTQTVCCYKRCGRNTIRQKLKSSSCVRSSGSSLTWVFIDLWLHALTDLVIVTHSSWSVPLAIVTWRRSDIPVGSIDHSVRSYCIGRKSSR